MRLTIIEPSAPHIELRTYECADKGDSFLVAI